jgi:ABC transporter substrate binding protein
VDLIFISQPGAAKAVQMAATRIPVIFAGVGDLIGLGLMQSFAQPGGSIAGVTNLDLEEWEDAMMLGDEVLIGQTALEKLDLFVDGVNQRLVPNPAHPDQPVSKVK